MTGCKINRMLGGGEGAPRVHMGGTIIVDGTLGWGWGGGEGGTFVSPRMVPGKGGSG